MAQKYSTQTRGANALKTNRFERIEEEIIQNKELKKAVQTEQDSAKHVRKLYTFMLLSVIIVTVFAFVLLLKAEFTVSRTTASVYAIEQELTQINNENKLLEGTIVERMDYQKIYDRAIALGMNLPGIDELSWIESEPTSYTEQYIVIETNERPEQKNASFATFMLLGW